MRVGAFIILAGLLTTGCATHQDLTAAQQRQQAELAYDDGGASSVLAFDPPIAQNAPRVNLSRSGRETSAFFGFDQPTVSSFYTWSDDHQVLNASNSDNPNASRFDRHSYTATFGVSSR